MTSPGLAPLPSHRQTSLNPASDVAVESSSRPGTLWQMPPGAHPNTNPQEMSGSPGFPDRLHLPTHHPPRFHSSVRHHHGFRSAQLPPGARSDLCLELACLAKASQSHPPAKITSPPRKLQV